MSKPKQMCILSIGYQDILLPDIPSVEILRVLQSGVSCRDRIFNGEIELLEKSYSVELKLVPPKTLIRRPEDPKRLEHRGVKS